MSDKLPGGSPRDTDPRETDPREGALRRLLTEAVEPVLPAPGAQARLLAKARRRRRRAHQGPVRLRLAGGVLAATAVLVAGGVYFAGHSGEQNSNSSASGAGSTSASVPSAPSAGPSSAAGKAAGGMPAAGSAMTPEQRASNNSTQDQSGALSNQRYAPKAGALVPPDLDGDGAPDSVTIEGAALVARLSRDGLQRVTLPPTGAGARVLGITLLDSASGGQVPVVFVRLQERAGYTQDTLAGLVAGRLSVLKLGSTPILLVRDAGHAYSCAGPLLISAGSSRSYVVSGSALQIADARLAAARPAAPGCDFG